jgi:hypothetical protein
MHDLSLCAQYDLYNYSFDKISRADVDTALDFFLVEAQMAGTLKKTLTKARTLPGQLGLASTRYLAPLSKSVDLEILIAALRANPNSWMEQDGHYYWYCMEDRENVIINMAGKAFALADQLDTRRLAECLNNALKARATEHEYPDAERILSFIRGSRYFNCGKSTARFLGERGELTDVQKAIVRFFRNKSAASWTDINSYLQAKGFGRALISKAVMQSPLIFVDRTVGRGDYAYTLISHGQTAERTQKDVDSRYEQFRKRLRKIEDIGTDAPVESKSRREQGILQEWLFGEKKEEQCAICGKRFRA